MSISANSLPGKPAGSPSVATGLEFARPIRRDGRFVAEVQLNCSDSNVRAFELEMADLLSFQAFRKALAKQGVVFIDTLGEFQGRGGAKEWDAWIMFLLDS